MNRKIPFVKYTSYGNNFVIVDETETQVFSENEKVRFAGLATNIYFGVGSDNFLVIQRCSKDVFVKINQARRYWSETPESIEADFVFRMFEPDGTEALSCGNGLMCIAGYLFRRYHMQRIRIVTEIPTATPKVVTIGTESGDNTSWANLGHPRKIPLDMFKPPVSKPYDDVIHSLDDLTITFRSHELQLPDDAIHSLDEIAITFRSHDLQPFSDKTNLVLKAYLVFTGEPHLVVFPGREGVLERFEQVLFAASPYNTPSGKNVERRINYGIWLVDQIGSSINSKHLNIFPAGMNVNFARQVSNNSSNTLEYRCFERGINRETLACGTGALAVSYISRRLNLIQSQKNTVLPYRCRLYDSDAQIHVKEDENGCQIHGYPVMLFEGEFEFKES